jgi:hypothetical protein
MKNQQYPALANRAIAREVEALDPAKRENFEERAGILQYEGDMSRGAAEALALRQVTAPRQT